jgi:hypothetical protein
MVRGASQDAVLHFRGEGLGHRHVARGPVRESGLAVNQAVAIESSCNAYIPCRPLFLYPRSPYCCAIPHADIIHPSIIVFLTTRICYWTPRYGLCD